MPDWDPATAFKDVLLIAVGIHRLHNFARGCLDAEHDGARPIAAIDDPLFDT